MSIVTTPATSANSVTTLNQRVSDMIADDRTGVCMAVAVIGATTERAIVCADPSDLKRRSLTYESAFEVGSLSKLMTANVLARLIREAKLTLETPLKEILPKGTTVPSYNGQPIKLKHLVTHTSGLPVLPSRMSLANADNPYKTLSKQTLLDSLKDVQLSNAPGKKFEYSNYAMMLLSFGLAHHSGESFEDLLQQTLFQPLNMQHSFSQRPPERVQQAQGHSQSGNKVPHWDFAKNMQGVGGVRSSLNDMVRYAQANLRLLTTDALADLTLTHQEVLSVDGQSLGMNWMAVKLGSAQLLMHEGGTGGFSSAIVLEPQQQRGVVILADTALTNLGGVGRHALALMDLGLPDPSPRKTVEAPQSLLSALSGEYTLGDMGLTMTLWEQDGGLMAQATGQDAFTLQFDSEGDFYPSAFDALLRPTKTANGQGFEWHQGGGVMIAKPVSQKASSFKLNPALLDDYLGSYPLMPGFALEVTHKQGELFIQGTGQPALPVTAVATDEFSFDKAGAYFIFKRNDSGTVTSIVLKQRGQTLTGAKQ